MKKIMDEEFTIVDQEVSDEDKELIDLVYKRVEIFEAATRDYRNDARIAREIMRLNDPYQDTAQEREKGEKTLQLQTLKSTIDNCVADQLQNIPEPKFLPELPELEQAALDLQDTMRYVLFGLNKFEKVHRKRSYDFYTVGTAVTQIVWDENMSLGKGDIAVFRWPVEAFLWDPTAEDIQDSRAVIKVSWHPLSWYRAHYPENGKYVKADENMYNDVGVPDSQRNLGDMDEPRAALFEYWYREFNASTNRYTINVAYVAGGALLAHDKDVYVHGKYPFVVDVMNDIEGQPTGDGLVAEFINMQRYINKYARYIDTNLRMSSKARMLERRGSGIDTKAMADWSSDFIEGDRIIRGEDWDWLAPPPMNNMVVQQMENMKNALKQDSGMNSFSRGESSGGIVSGKAILALQEAGNKIANMNMVVLNQGTQEIAEQCVWLMAQFYNKERMVLLTGNTGEHRQAAVSAKHFFGDAYKKIKDGTMPPPYFVQIEISRRNPARIDAMNEMFMQAYTMAAQAQQYFPLSALFRIMNIDGKDRLLPIIEANEARQNQMQQMQQTIEQMGQQIEQMQKENDNLKSTAMQATNAMANIGANRGGGFTGMQNPNGNPETINDAVMRARQNVVNREASMSGMGG